MVSFVGVGSMLEALLARGLLTSREAAPKGRIFMGFGGRPGSVPEGRRDFAFHVVSLPSFRTPTNDVPWNWIVFFFFCARESYDKWRFPQKTVRKRNPRFKSPAQSRHGMLDSNQKETQQTRLSQEGTPKKCLLFLLFPLIPVPKWASNNRQMSNVHWADFGIPAQRIQLEST